VLAGGVFICLVHQADSMLIAVAGVLLGSLRLSDAHCIARLKEFQRQLGIHDDRVEFVAGGDVATPFKKLILGVHRLGRSHRVLANHVFEHYHVAGTPHGIIRLRGDYQCECLKVRGNIQLAALATHQYFTQVH
jgi:hypothetical protein